MSRLLLAFVLCLPAAVAAGQPAKTVKVTVLSTMLVGNSAAGIGEWGFAAVLEVDGHRLLIDTGARAETVLKNAAELNVDLSTITDLVLTHNHADQTGGLLTLRRESSRKQPSALSRVHVPRGIFYPRPGAGGREGNGLLPLKAAYEGTGGLFIEHAGAATIMPVRETDSRRQFFTRAAAMVPTSRCSSSRAAARSRPPKSSPTT